ncbi:MAG: hypothetical protein ACOH2H_12730 [Cypionkella sp.]
MLPTFAAFLNLMRAPAKPFAIIRQPVRLWRPEFPDFADVVAEGFIWGSVIGVYADDMAFREACQALYPGTIGMV